MTPQQEYADLAKNIGLPDHTKLYLKREDLHPLKSHKGRSLPYMIDSYIAEGTTEFALSSSGNAALAAALHIKQLVAQGTSAHLTIFIGERINSAKLASLEELADDSIRIVRSERPLQSLFTFTKDSSVQGLRQSTDDRALRGYDALADELLKIPDLTAVFIGTSSGTTAQALAEYFIEHDKPIQIHIVQTLSCHPLTDALADTSADNTSTPSEVSLADAIVDQTALRKSALIPLIEKTGGRGFIASNESITAAQELCKRYADISITPNGALSVAGLMNALYEGWDAPKGSIACIVTGA